MALQEIKARIIALLGEGDVRRTELETLGEELRRRATLARHESDKLQEDTEMLLDRYEALKSVNSPIPWDEFDSALIAAGRATEEQLDEMTGTEKLELA